MATKGFIETNNERLDDFLRSIVTRVANHQTRLTLRLYEEFDFGQLAVTQLNKPDSPFPGSDSQLAGDGYLMAVEPNTVDVLVDALLDCWIMHLELEVDGQVAIAAYDGFECVSFRDPIMPTFLEALKRQDIIDNYGLDEG